jgi:uncharacterized protein YdcH (DUF465 family)
MEEQKIKEILIETDSEFRMLFVKHQELEEKLQYYLQKKSKSDEERVAEKNTKKEKLKLKDAMQKHICAYKKKTG